jgi:hypothetical protein
MKKVEQSLDFLSLLDDIHNKARKSTLIHKDIKSRIDIVTKEFCESVENASKINSTDVLSWTFNDETKLEDAFLSLASTFSFLLHCSTFDYEIISHIWKSSNSISWKVWKLLVDSLRYADFIVLLASMFLS